MASGGSGVKGDAFSGYGTASGQANNAYGVSNPIYTQMAQNPQGYTPQQMANEQTASAQTTGGSMAGAVGQGALASARTNNAGGYQAAEDDSARGAQAQASQNNLNIQNQNTQLQNQHQQEGLAGLSSEYGQGNETALGYLGIANTAKPTYLQNLASTYTNDVLNGVTGQKGTWGGGQQGCWIAEAIYGADDRRTHVVRAYLNGPFRESSIGDWIMRMYVRFGERIAYVVKRSRVLKTMFRPFFDAALSRALEGTCP